MPASASSSVLSGISCNQSETLTVWPSLSRTTARVSTRARYCPSGRIFSKGICINSAIQPPL